MKRDELLIATAALMGFEFPIETSVALPHVVGGGNRALLRVELYRLIAPECRRAPQP